MYLVVVSSEEGLVCLLQGCRLWALFHQCLEVCEGRLAGALCALTRQVHHGNVELRLHVAT